MTEGVSNYISLFEDDSKLLRKIRNHKVMKHSSEKCNGKKKKRFPVL